MCTFEEFLFQLCFGDLNLYSLVNLFSMSALMISVILDGSRKEGVDESRFSQSGLASNLFTR